MHQSGTGGDLIKLKPPSLILFNAGYRKIKLSRFNVCAHGGWDKSSLRNWAHCIARYIQRLLYWFIHYCFLPWFPRLYINFFWTVSIKNVKIMLL